MKAGGVGGAGYSLALTGNCCVCCSTNDEPETGLQAVNDTLRAVEIEVTVRRGAEVLFAEDEAVPPNGRKILGAVPTSKEPVFYEIEWCCEDSVFRDHYLAGARPFELGACRSWYRQVAEAES